MTTLQERLDTIRAGFESKAPADETEPLTAPMAFLAESTRFCISPL